MKQNRKGNSKIDEQIKKSLYKWIIHHPQVVQLPIVNDCLKVKIDGHAEPQLVTKMLLQVSVRELHNKLVISTIDVGLKESRDEDDNIIIIDYKLCSVLPPQLKKTHQDSRYVWLLMLHICQKYTSIVTFIA